jgi:hypothetical protein
MEEVSFATACWKFFKAKEGQSLSSFQMELKELTEKDKADLSAWFPSVGYTIKKVP